MKRRFGTPTPAFVVALVALFVGLGGTTYAATSLPKGSVGTAQLKNWAVTKAKINQKTVAALKGRASHNVVSVTPNLAGFAGNYCVELDRSVPNGTTGAVVSPNYSQDDTN